MPKLVNRAKMTTATTGTGTLTLGSAVDGYQTFANAGVANGNIVRYTIEDGSAWEIGLGTYSSTGTTLSRGTIESSTGTAINLSGNATVFVTAAAGDLQELVTFAETFALPTVDGTNGQVLTTNGSGTLSFTTISGYTNAAVDAHLNTSTAASGEVLSWNGSDYDWVSGGATDINGLSDGISAGNVLALGNGAFGGSTPANTFLSSTAVGYQALFTGAQSRATAFGSGALRSLSGGTDSTAVGQGALYSATSPSRSTAFGSFSGYNVTTASDTVAIGAYALYGDATSKLTGASNIGIGYQTGYDLSTGAYNFLGGHLAGTNLTTGSNNVAIANGALDSATTGGENVAIGLDAGGGVSTATRTVFIGPSAGSNASNGMGIGYRAARYSTAESNTAVGNEALADTLLTGNTNSAFGFQALRNVESGNGNTGVGYVAGSNITTGSNNLVLGNGAQASSATVSNEITLGDSSITNLRVPGVGFRFDTTDGLIVPKTVTAAGTTGAQTINKTAGTVNFAAAATSLVVTNSFVDANSVIIATVGTNDSTMKSVAAVAGAGSFTLHADAAPTAETRVNWFVAN